MFIIAAALVAAGYTAVDTLNLLGQSDEDGTLALRLEQNLGFEKACIMAAGIGVLTCIAIVPTPREPAQPPV
jgi:hypothetical protein